MLRNRKPTSYFARPPADSRDDQPHSGEHRRVRVMILLHPALERIPGELRNGMPSVRSKPSSVLEQTTHGGKQSIATYWIFRANSIRDCSQMQITCFGRFFP